MRILLIFLLVTAMPLAGQSDVVTVRPLPDLVAALPSILHNNPKADLGPYWEEVDKAYKANPSGINSLGPTLTANLADPSHVVQASTLMMVYGFTMKSQDPSLALSLTKELVSALTTPDEFVQKTAALVVESLGPAAPDLMVGTLIKLLQQPATPDETLFAAGEALMIIRPDDDTAQGAVVSIINDEKRPSDLRTQFLYATANGIGGSKVLANAIQIANTSNNHDLRDSAISAASRFGSRGLIPITATVQRISQDPKESDESRRNAAHALDVLTRTAR